MRTVIYQCNGCWKTFETDSVLTVCPECGCSVYLTKGQMEFADLGQRNTVYEFPNGFAQQAEQVYKAMRLRGLNPFFGNYTDGNLTIWVSSIDAKCLLILANINPATFGNRTTIETTIRKYQEKK